MSDMPTRSSPPGKQALSRAVSRRKGLALAAAGLLSLAAASLPRPAHAQSADAAKSFIGDFGGKLVGIVNSPESIDEKKKQVLPLLQQNVDVTGIGKFCLGRYWRNTTPDQQQKYLALFDHVLVNAITDKIGDYKGVHFTVNSATPSPGGQLVSALVARPGQPEVNMQLLVTESDGHPKVADMIGEGASLRLTQRQDYGSYLARNGGNVDTLISALQRQLDRHH